MATAQNPAHAVPTTTENIQIGLRHQLEERRHRLERIAEHASDAQLQRLLDDVDAALHELEAGRLGVCSVCHECVEPERLMADPLARFCLDHLPPEQARALEADLELAARLQSRLLPDKKLRADGWQVAYDYRPAGIVSGDYCDLVTCCDTGNLYFALGDVSGKGVAASMLMSNLSAMFRALVPLSTSLPELMAHANRVLCESTLPNMYATLILGRATRTGEVEICNAGHLEPLIATHDGIVSLDGASAPIGLFCSQTFTSTRVQLAPGDALLLYSDGISEARNPHDEEYGTSRLSSVLRESASLAPEQALAACTGAVAAFVNGARQHDDQTVLLLQRA
jgi:phosphoserine phosphatase RsbU/P